MKKILLIILAFILCTASNSYATDFITRWDLGWAGGVGTSITIGVETSGPVSYTWETVPPGATGSGTFTGPTAVISGLPMFSTVRLKINPENFKRIRMNASPDGDLLADIEQWGTVIWTSMSYAFFDCEILDITASDVPNLSVVNDIGHMFYYCNDLTGPSNINSWNTSNVTNMSGVFMGATSFNQPLGSWNTSNVTNMSGMFWHAYPFNQPIDSWNTSNVINMSYMFASAHSFNQPLASWNTSNVHSIGGMFSYANSFNQPLASWNTSNVAGMGNTFNGATSFNQPLASWNTINVTSMDGMFKNATSFNQPLDAWNLFSVDDLTAMLDNSAMDCANYSATLYSWSSNPLTPSGLNLGALNMNYGTDVAAARNNLIVSKSWTIAGDIASVGGCYLTTVTAALNGSSVAGHTQYELCNSDFANVTIVAPSPSAFMWYSATSLTGPFNTCCGASNVLDAFYLIGSSTLTYFYCQVTSPAGIVTNTDTFSIMPLANLSNDPITLCTTDLPTTWNGITIPATATTNAAYTTFTTTNAEGCDSVITLDLTIINSSVSSSPLALCTTDLPTTWNGITIPATATTNPAYTTYTATNAAGCDSVVTLDLTVNLCNGIGGENSTVFSIAPNPFADAVNIIFANQATHTIEIMDVFGKTIVQHTTNENNFALNTSTWAAGIYMIKVDGVSKKMIKN